MTQDERDVHEQEDEARRTRTAAEAERAEGERETEVGGEGDEGVLPSEADEQRRGVMPPPGDDRDT